MLIPYNPAFKEAYEKSNADYIEPILKVAYDNQEDAIIGLSNSLSPLSFLLTSELKKSNPNSELVLKCIEKLKSSTIHFGIVDDETYICPIDTRGDQIIFSRSSEKEKELFIKNYERLKTIIPEKHTDFYSIIRTVTLVSITGKEELLEHFSGSDSDRWGAMHMSNNLCFLNVAECLTHEASHHWLNLYEIYNQEEFIKEGWTDHSFISPWRRDRRPLMGLYHGIYVFSNVFIVLQYLDEFYNEADKNRMHYVAAQVRRGIEIMELNADKMSSGAQELLSEIKSVFQKAYQKTPELEQQKYYTIILNEEKSKLESV
jgi:hypothetical protein